MRILVDEMERLRVPSRWVGGRSPIAGDAGSGAPGEQIVARAGRRPQNTLAGALVRAVTEDELGEVVAARGREIGTGIALAALFVPDAEAWRLAGARGPSADALGRALARASRRASPLVLTSRAALAREAPALASLRGTRAPLRAAALIPIRRGRKGALGVLLLGFRRPLRSPRAALDAGGLLASICATTLVRLGRARERGWSAPSDAFVGMAAHELKSPIASALVHLGVLRRELLRPDRAPGVADHASVRVSLDSVAGELGRLHSLVRFLADVAAERHRPEGVDRMPNDLGPIIRDAADAAVRDAEQAPRIRFQLASPLWVACDAVQIERVIGNLVSNAIKYGDGKPIDISARAAGPRVIIRIKDRGIGVARADGARIFDRFARSDLARAYPGLGLGLWLARTIVEAHRGTVRVGRGAGRGSTFEVSLPRLTRVSPARQP